MQHGPIAAPAGPIHSSCVHSATASPTLSALADTGALAIPAFGQDRRRQMWDQQQSTLFLGASRKPDDSYQKAEELLLKFANRHGIVTGATGTGKTVTLQ